jgi:molybdopterin molybdotransferase
MTGAPVPEGADAVVRMEDSRKENGRVAILVGARVGQDIRRAGEDVQPGEKVISRGEVIRPAEVGMLAALGRSFISVHQRPLIAVVATGDELTDIDELLSPWKIVSSNSYSIAALVLDCGAIPLQIGIAKDRREDLIAKFRDAMRADLIVSSGGVSVGDYDLVKEVMKKEGNRMQFWRVAMKPGRPLAFGAMGEVPIVGLPGNPVSSMVSFEQFIRPAILKMMGHVNLFRRTVRARLGEDIDKNSGIRHFIRARICREEDGYTVVTTGEQGSGILKSMVRANGLIILSEEITKVRAGEMVTVQLLDDSLDRITEPGY